jgi:hypothetical protein
LKGAWRFLDQVDGGVSMPFRVDCPKCKGTLNLADDKRGKKIRCSKCQGVFVAMPAKAGTPAPSTARKTKPAQPDPEPEIIEEVEEEVEIDEEERPRRRARSRERDEADEDDQPEKMVFRPKRRVFNTALFMGVMMSVAVVVGAVGAGWWIVNRMNPGVDDYDSAMSQYISLCREAATAVEKAKDDDSAKEAAEKLDAISARMEALGKRLSTMELPTPEVEQKHESERGSVESRFDVIAQKAQETTRGSPALRNACERFRRAIQLIGEQKEERKSKRSA